jgi:TrmH family RNA methyltransferase
MTVKVSAEAQPSAVDVRFVLVEPQFAGNVGSCARALKNLGFGRLCLVRPRCDPRDAEARRMAVDAADVLESILVCDDLATALEGARTVVGTSRRTGKHRWPHYRLDAFAPELAQFAASGSLAVLFGREDHGLSDAELDRCTHLVHIPAADPYPSFNLAQAVLLVAYELFCAMGAPAPAAQEREPATDAEREAFYEHLRQALWAVGYLHRDSDEPIMRRVRRLFGRTSMTVEEVRLLRGVARQTLWIAGRAGFAPPADIAVAAAMDDAASGESP